MKNKFNFKIIYSLFILYFFVFTLSCFAQKLTVADSLRAVVLRDSARVAAKDSLCRFIDKMMSQADMQHATFGFSAMYAQADTILFSYNAQQSMATASVMKVITTSTALNLLGKDFRFETTLEYDGEIKDSVLYGNLYVKGGGDPTLASNTDKIRELLCEWYYAVEKLGIKRITGSVVADETIFDNQAVHNRWAWEDIGNGYGAGSYGLNFHDNLYYLTLKSDKEGDTTHLLSVYPPQDSLVMYNQLVAGAKDSGDNSVIYASPYSNTVVISGSIPPNRQEFTVRGAIPNPPLYAVQRFHQVLLANSIKIDKQPFTVHTARLQRKNLPTQRQSFYTYYSTTLDKIIKTTNVKSNNLYAESILRIMGNKLCEKGATASGVRVVTEYLALNGINLNGFFMEDGSGLSRFNAICPEQLLRIMQLQTRSPYFEIFYQSLPIVGQTGTLQNIGKNTIAEGKIRAKSGSMTRVRCYTGYVTTQTGELLVFAVMANNYGCKGSEIIKRMEKIMIHLAGLPF
jgi:D-alanyl-D-alanine carboxypeptidase/D-alanyl-D-alanine-endopeptidase (penicillin-binding protein 4)